MTHTFVLTDRNDPVETGFSEVWSWYGQARDYEGHVVHVLQASIGAPGEPDHRYAMVAWDDRKDRQHCNEPSAKALDLLLQRIRDWL